MRDTAHDPVDELEDHSASTDLFLLFLKGLQRQNKERVGEEKKENRVMWGDVCEAKGLLTPGLMHCIGQKSLTALDHE